MKKIIAILILILAVETYGVYGRAQADRIVFSCELEVGPLCYQWKANALGRIFGTDNISELEDDLETAKELWDAEFITRIEEGLKAKSDIERALDAFHQRASDRLDEAAGRVRKALEALEKK